MATATEALISSVLGLIGGVVGAGTIERLKAGVASLDAELVRLESVEDDLFDVFEIAVDDPERDSALRRLARMRRRLGQNIRRKIPDSVAYESCKVGLVQLDGILAKAEDAVPLSDELETHIEGTVARLRTHLKRSSRTARAFAILRGDA
jgi:hypothetical protein